MTRDSLVSQLRQHRRNLVDEAMSDQEVIDSCVICTACDQAELDENSVTEFISASENVEDFFVRIDEAKKAARVLEEEVEARGIFHRHRRELFVRFTSNMNLDPGLMGQLVSRGATERGAIAFMKSLEEAMREQASHIPPIILARMLF